jgi:cellulose synthase/poly-beta-1,6-N-acetylglucosamine synthase-like glycosyltransferase
MALIENLPLVITTIFLITIISYYILIFIKLKKPERDTKFSSITVIIPAHNEEEYIADSIKSVIDAKFDGTKEIFVVDDGSKDNTYNIAKEYNSRIRILRTKHTGKAASLNKALSLSKGDLIAVVDGDSSIKQDALMQLKTELERKNTVAATGIVKVKNRKKYICMWVHIEQLYNSLMRLLFSKINANIVTPGPLSMYRKKELLQNNGFSTDGFSEDIDVTIRMIRKGHRIGFSEKAIAETNMPFDIKGFLRQRTRYARGMLNIFKRHMRFRMTVIDFYTMPLFFFYYIQAVIMGAFTIYQITSGYIQYFTSNSIFFSMPVFWFFFDWMSIVGFIKWTWSIISGMAPLTLIAAVGIISTFLSYPLYILSIIKFDKKFDIWHLVPILFMFPFWLIIMSIYILMIPDFLRKNQHNIWKKNE